MRIGFAAPLSLAAVNGGVRTQVMQTALHLRDLGVDIEFIHFDQPYFNYDLVHVFSAGVETIGIAKQTVERNIPLIVSPVFFSNRSAATISASLIVEKTISGFGSGIRSDFGIKANICNWADAVLPNTETELALVKNGLKIESKKLHLIPNGVESRFKNASPDLFKKTYGIENFILFVGQAGAPRKNVIKLLQASKKIDSQVVIIGDFYDNDYSRNCYEIAHSQNNVLLIESLDHNDPILESAYAASSVFCLPSFYETPGIAALEAALAGSKIVITKKGGTKEYFGNDARYIDPESYEDVLNSIHTAMSDNSESQLAENILSRFTWEVVAEKTLDIYKKFS